MIFTRDENSFLQGDPPGISFVMNRTFTDTGENNQKWTRVFSTRRSDASEKNRRKILASTFGRFRLWTSFESSPVSVNVKVKNYLFSAQHVLRLDQNIGEDTCAKRRHIRIGIFFSFGLFLASCFVLILARPSKRIVNPSAAAATFSLQISKNAIFNLLALNEIL